MQLIQSFFSFSGNIAILFLIALFMFAGCSSIVASTKDIKDSSALRSNVQPLFNPLDTPLGRPYYAKLQSSPNLTGAILVSDGIDAFLHRAYLARMATKSIMLQTYIYKNDLASRILMHEVWLAAQRGVIVKMLIDDNGLDSDFSDIVALDSHPNIEVRIFNPYKNRNRILRYPEMIFDFNRINHRMHNKLFIVDDIALIIGGRNLADNYFDQNSGVNFIDTDVLFIGKAAQDARTSFNAYWDFHRSIPVSLLKLKMPMRRLKASMEKIKNNPQWGQYEAQIKTLMYKYKNGDFKAQWGHAVFIADTPLKIDDPSIPSPIAGALGEILNFTRESLYISAAYLVPSKEGMKHFKSLLDSGVSVHILTNSLASTDSLVVYGAWERYRDALIEQGAHIYELQYMGAGKSKLRDKMLKSKASLHSKSIVFDKKITWIGSFNLDPRSANLNTESVVVFDNPHFATLLLGNIKAEMGVAWRLYNQKGKTRWEGDDDGVWKQYAYPPDTGFWTRILKSLSKILPENQI